MSSPSMVHEGVIALVRDNPAFAASVLRDLLHVEVPRFSSARLTEAALPELVPVEYHADAVVLFDGVIADQAKPVLGTIFEVQLERKDRKRYSWPLYAVAARARHECPFILTVVTPDAAVARWADQPIELGNGWFAPCVIGPQGIPQVTDRDQAAREPQLAVLSVVAHGNGDIATAMSIARAAIDASRSLPDEQRVLYSALIEKALSEAARKALEMEPQIKQFFSDAHQRSYAKGKAEGEAKGRAEAVRMILQQRGLVMTDEQQRQVLSCTDVTTLDRWLARALSVASVDELLA
ncbi:MAG TPA: hypothetical protein VHT91_05035 [Kofleriaceae bacterium]|nr:hypothetical protein [Kofleriaceae bacterium]